MKIIVIDGQGGKIGTSIVKQLKQSIPGLGLMAIGTNSIATASMLKAGADCGASGENPVVVNCRDADIIIGPLGILLADSLLGEVTPAMAQAIAQSPAQKILIPNSKCKVMVTGVRDMALSEYIQLAIELVTDLIGGQFNMQNNDNGQTL
ncbi:MAG: DUF3842 family protein [Bacillota bacterium]|nr:DUF3842 family protein [Bacillota bacterium]